MQTAQQNTPGVMELHLNDGDVGIIFNTVILISKSIIRIIRLKIYMEHLMRKGSIRI